MYQFPVLYYVDAANGSSSSWHEVRCKNDVNVLFACRMVRLFMLIGCQPKIRNQAKYKVRMYDVHVLSTVLILKYLCLCTVM